MLIKFMNSDNLLLHLYRCFCLFTYFLDHGIYILLSLLLLH